MKKSLIIAGLACVALAACTKNEVVSVAPDQEITFHTVINPSTKSLGTGQSAFAPANRFRTWAFYDENNWNPSSITSQLYLGGTAGLEIQRVGTVWKNETNSYYWPKNGKLTFFSYSLNARPTMLTTGTVSCTNGEGIKVAGYDIVDNLNVDFMVADIAKDRTANENTYETEGVPTLFRHKLSNVVFQVIAAGDYYGKTIRLNSIKLNNVFKTATYQQSVAYPTNEGWQGNTTDNIDYHTDGTIVTTTLATPTAIQSYYIPQKFDDETAFVTISYTITTENGTATPAKETITVNKPLKDIFTESWKMGKKYICKITISLNEILWDPAVQDWEDGAVTAPTI